LDGGSDYVSNAVYFARTPLACLPYAWGGQAGLIYAVRLAVEKPLHCNGIWGRGAYHCRTDTDEIAGQGHDCVLMHHLWDEIAVFSPVEQGQAKIVGVLRADRLIEAFGLAFQSGQDAAIERAWRGRITPSSQLERQTIWQQTARLGGAR
jgi:hypothetical protein